MIVYGSSSSPFVRKVMVFAAEKGLDATLMGPGDDPEFFRAASPFGKIPALRDGDFLLSDSSAIVAYIEKRHPEPALIPDQPRAHALTVWFEEYADSIVQACVAKIFYHRVAAPIFYGKAGKPEVADAVERDQFPKVAAYLESVLPASGYLVEDRLTLADIAVASAFASLDQGRCWPDPATCPKAVAYLQSIWARPSFAGMLARDRAIIGDWDG